MLHYTSRTHMRRTIMSNEVNTMMLQQERIEKQQKAFVSSLRIKDDANDIAVYLEEFYNLIREVSNEDHTLNAGLEHLIKYYRSEGVQNYTEALIYTDNNGKKEFNEASIFYLLERRRLVIHGGFIYVVFAHGVNRLDDEYTKDKIKLEFGILHDKECGQLVNMISMLNAVRKTEDKLTGDIMTRTVPSSYNPNLVRFSDCDVDLKTLKTIPISYNSIPKKRLERKYALSMNEQKNVDTIRQLLLFIADYDVLLYNRLIQFMGYAFTKKQMEKMFILLGEGGNGKGVFLQLMDVLYSGDSFRTSSLLEIAKGNSVTKDSAYSAMLPSKVSLIEDESDFSAKTFSEVYKSFADGGSAQVRQLKQNSKSLSNQSVFYVATNYTEFAGYAAGDNAFTRRVQFADFTNTFITKADTDLVTSVLGNVGREGAVCNFVNMLHIVTDDFDPSLTYKKNANRLGDRNKFETRKSVFVKNLAIQDTDTRMERFAECLLNKERLFEDCGIELSQLFQLTDCPVDNAKDLGNLLKGVDKRNCSMKRGGRGGAAKLVLGSLWYKMLVLGNVAPTDFAFHKDVDEAKMFEIVSSGRIRVTQLAHQLGLVGVRKAEFKRYVSSVEGLKIVEVSSGELGSTQPFVELDVDSEDDYIEFEEVIEEVVEEVVEEPSEDDLFIAQLIADLEADEKNRDNSEPLSFAECKRLEHERDVTRELDALDLLMMELEQEEEVVEENEDYLVSVFEQPRYPIGNVDKVTRKTSKIDSIISPVGCEKHETYKFFPYGIETRGGEIEPSKLLALDFDDETNGTDLDVVLREFEALGYSGYLQESYSSMSEGSPYLRFHVILQCNDFVHQTCYNDIAEEIAGKTTFVRDLNMRYKTLVSCSSKRWYKFGTDLVDVKGYEPSVPREAEKVLEDGREVIEDRSHILTLQDYLIDSAHDTADYFLSLIHEDMYGVGNRDDSVYRVCMYLNECKTDYNMNQSVYSEGYKTLYKLVYFHPVAEGRRQLLDKIEGHFIK